LTLAIALVIAANFAFAQLRPKKEYLLEEQVEDMRKVVTTYDALNELTKVQEEAGLYDNEGSDIYTEDELKDWDSTLMDGLEDKEWEEKPKGVPVYFDPETGRPYIIEETEDEEVEDEDLIEEDTNKDLSQLELEFPPHPSKPLLTEEEKQYDLNNDGVLDIQEQNKMAEDKILNNPGISAWRKKKLRDYLDGKTKRYF